MKFVRTRFWCTGAAAWYPDQAGLRIKRFIEIIILSETGFGAKEPPPGTPDQAGLRIKSFIQP